MPMSEYTFRNFLRDRRPYVAAYAAFGLLAVAVIQLDLWLQGASLQFANVAYILLLGVVILAAFLAYEWRRQASFFRRLSDIEHLGQTGPGARSDAADGALVGNTWTHARGPVAPGTSAAREAAPTVASLDDHEHPGNAADSRTAGVRRRPGRRCTAACAPCWPKSSFAAGSGCTS